MLRKRFVDFCSLTAGARCSFVGFDRFNFAFSGRSPFLEVKHHQTMVIYYSYQSVTSRINLESETALNQLGSFHQSSLDCAHQPL